MRRIILALAAVATMTAGATTAAKAVEFDVGPGGVYVGPRHHHWRDSYNWDRGECRVIIDRHVNRWGERVVERRRVCD